MSSQFAQQLWEQYRTRIRQLTPEILFLEIDLRQVPNGDSFDGSQFSDFLFEWFRQHHVKRGFLLLHRQRQEPWRDPHAVEEYQEFLEFFPEQHPAMSGCSWKGVQPAAEILSIIQRHPESAVTVTARQHQAVVFSPQLPFCLDVIKIPKPWGYEGWYTGVEKRGIVTVSSEFGVTELPYALGLFRSAFLGNFSEQLILLKTLNPVKEEVLGDLYLEMHEQKWEVYVVIEMDPLAWPTGVGIIKAGLRQDTIEKFQHQHGQDWGAKYLDSFQKAIADYEIVRRQIDAFLDQQKLFIGIAENDAIAPEQMEALLHKVPDDVREKEQQLREKAYEFVGEYPVRVGDVFAFPVHQMHSLQHGVRVIEFQTPHYDRLIVMFAQKVLTQSSWDTRHALSLMKLEPYQPPKLTLLEQTNAVLNERFVNFPDFTADRITLQPSSSYKDQTDSTYHLIIVVSGTATLQIANGQITVLKKEGSVFIPVMAQRYTIQSSEKEPLVYLKAMPQKKISNGAH